MDMLLVSGSTAGPPGELSGAVPALCVLFREHLNSCSVCSRRLIELFPEQELMLRTTEQIDYQVTTPKIRQKFEMAVVFVVA